MPPLAPDGYSVVTPPLRIYNPEVHEGKTRRGRLASPLLIAAAMLAPAAADAAPARSDLTVSRVAPSSARLSLGGVVKVRQTVANRGTASAGRSTARYYLSTNGRRSARNLLLGSHSVPAVRPGFSARGGANIRVSRALPPGSYRLIVCADGARRVREARESNNCRVSSGWFTVARAAAPPLVAPFPSPPPTPSPSPDPLAPEPPPPGPTDTTAPAVTIASPAPGESKNPTPSFGGTAATGPGDADSVTVRVYSGSAASGTPLQSRSAGVAGDGSWQVDAAPMLDEGTYTARAEQLDSAGNLGTSAPRTFTIVPAKVMAAGDAACSTSDTAYNGGLGTADRCRQRYVSDLFVAAAPDAVLVLGDLQYERGRLPEFEASYNPSYGRVKDVTYPSIGNHEYDDPAGGAQGYFDYFNGVGNSTGRAGDRSRGYYSFDVGGWHVISLNSNCLSVPPWTDACAAGSTQEQWLRADLAANAAKCTLAYWHHPRFSSGAQPGNTAYTAFWQALQDYDADVVLSAHAHDYERFGPLLADGTIDDAQGIRSFVVGTGGKSHHPFPSSTFQPGSEAQEDETYGALELTLRPRGYSWAFRPEAGKTYSDEGSASCR